MAVTASEKSEGIPVFRRPEVARLLIVALLAEIGYAVLNISTMPVYLKQAAPLGPQLLPDGRGFSASVIGLVIAAFLLSEAIFKSPMGHLADRFGPKRLMLFGPLISVVTSLVTLFYPHTGPSTTEVLVLVLLRAFDGLGAAMIWPAAFSAVNEAVPDKERQQGMSLLNLCYMLGIALAFPLGGLVNDLTRTRWAGIALAAVLFLIVALLVWRLIPSIKIREHSAAVEAEHGLKDFFKSIGQIPSYLVLAIVTFMGVGFPMVIFKIFPLQQFGMTETQIGFLIFPAAIAMAVFSVPLSRMGERIGRARAVHIGLGLCSLGMMLIGLGAVLPGLRSPLMFGLGGLPVGIGFLLTIPAWMASVSDIDPQRRGTNIGAVMTAQGLGAIIGAPIGSMMYDKLQPTGVALGLGESFGRYSPFLGCAICIMLGWLLSFKILKEPR
jgi:MFS transporter, DHA1 family, multidrug resistance protein